MPKSILSDGVYNDLLDAILKGKYKPGANLREEHLAEDLAVSRTPVREALRKLSEEGFVEYVPHRGARLVTPTATLAREIFQIREALEAVAAREASTRITIERLTKLRAHFETIRPRVAAGNWKDVGDILHDEIFAACGNHRLQQLVSVFRGQIRWLQSISSQLPDRLQSAFREHESVLSALESHNPDWAESAIRAHIRNTLADLLRHLQ
ncbi:MAG: GntR family transcriptional regulator [Bryobacteraceae bacterium]